MQISNPLTLVDAHAQSTSGDGSEETKPDTNTCDDFTSTDYPSTKSNKAWHKRIAVKFSKIRPKPTVNSTGDTPYHDLHATNKEEHKLWQCAQCQKINESGESECWGCKRPSGGSAKELFCRFCSLKVFTNDHTMLNSTFCPQCQNFLGKK